MFLFNKIISFDQLPEFDLYVPNMTITTNALRLIVPLELIYIDSPTNTIDD